MADGRQATTPVPFPGRDRLFASGSSTRTSTLPGLIHGSELATPASSGSTPERNARAQPQTIAKSAWLAVAEAASTARWVT